MKIIHKPFPVDWEVIGAKPIFSRNRKTSGCPIQRQDRVRNGVPVKKLQTMEIAQEAKAALETCRCRRHLANVDDDYTYRAFFPTG